MTFDPIFRAAALLVLLLVAPVVTNPALWQNLGNHWPLIAGIALLWAARKPVLAIIRWTAEGYSFRSVYALAEFSDDCRGNHRVAARGESKSARPMPSGIT